MFSESTLRPICSSKKRLITFGPFFFMLSSSESPCLMSCRESVCLKSSNGFGTSSYSLLLRNCFDWLLESFFWISSSESAF